MVRRMPVLGQHDVLEALGETVNQWNNLIPAWHRQASSGTEVILDVDHD
jgi:hypothetical protein